MSNCRGDGAGYSLFSSARKLGSADACRGGRHPPSWCSSATPIPTPVRLDGGGVLLLTVYLGEPGIFPVSVMHAAYRRAHACARSENYYPLRGLFVASCKSQFRHGQGSPIHQIE